MKVEIQKLNILRVMYKPAPGDKGYSGCMWAHFDFDLDCWALNIQSDCGNYAYRWAVEKDRKFLELMEVIGEDYLRQKLSKPDTVNIEETKKNIREYVIQDEEEEIAKRLDEGDTEEEIIEDLYGDAKEEGLEAVEAVKDKIEALESLDDDLSEYGSHIETSIAYKVVDDWNSDNDMEIDCPWELVAIEHSAWQKRIARIFVEYIQPKIHEYLKECAA